MLLQTVVRSSFIIFFMILCVKSTILDSRKCLVYEDLVTDAPEVEVEGVQTVHFNNHLSDITPVKYGQHLKLICDIYLPSPMNIKWKGRHREFKNGLSNDSRVLDIIFMNPEYHGEYVTCEASVVTKPKIRKAFGTNLKISDLAMPQISKLTPNNLTVMENENTTVSCKIVAGIPPPRVSWQFKRNGGDDFEDLSITGEDLAIGSTTFADDGQYRCIAENMKGLTSKTIDVTVEKLTVAVIEEMSEKTFPYGDTFEFTCKIQGYPLPKTVWKDNQGNELVSEDTKINWHEKISKLKLEKMKKSNNYTCFAENILGKAVSSVNVTVLSPFVVHNYPKETTNLNYGASTNIICNITSTEPMRIKWFRPKTANSSEQSEISTNKQFKITSHGTMLQIVSMDLELTGNYTCEASLVADVNEKIAFTTDVQIDDLAPPLLGDENKIIVMETNWITLYCKIFQGVPKPTLSWQAMRHGDTTYKDLSSSSEELDVENITIADAGKYRCVAKNAIGELSRVTDVLVRKAPVPVIEEGSTVTVAYGSNITFTCRVTAYPSPSITWEDTTKNALISEETEINEHEKISSLTVSMIRVGNTYHCGANNSLGEDSTSINVTISSPFVVHQHPEDITNVHYAASTNLVCNITSSFPLSIKWYHNSTEVHTSGRHTISANETVLHINPMDLDLVGNYKCEAILVSDASQKKAFTTDVKIDNLRPPVITHFNGPSVTVKNLQELSLVCNAMGHPAPVVTWQAMLRGSYSYQAVGQGENLCSTNFGSAQAGTYLCTATNVAGVDSRVINVAVY